jgi:hypothetical protein
MILRGKLMISLAYKVIFSRQALRDLQKLKQSGLGRQAKEIAEILYGKSLANATAL